ATVHRYGSRGSVGSAGFDANQAVAFEGQDAEHAITRTVNPFLQRELLAVVTAERVADKIAVLRHAALAFHFEGAVTRGVELAPATKGIGVTPGDLAQQNTSNNVFTRDHHSLPRCIAVATLPSLPCSVVPVSSRYTRSESRPTSTR